MNSIKIKLLLGLSVLLMAAACDKTGNDNALLSKPVVEAYLIPGQIVTVKLYKQKMVTDTNEYGNAITGLQVYISDGSKKVLLTESSAGVYTYKDLTFLVTGKTYTLQFQYLTHAVSAETVIPTKPVNFAIKDTSIYISTNRSDPNSPIDSLDWLYWDNPNLLNHVVVFKNLTGAGQGLTVGNYMGTTASFEINPENGSSYLITNYTFGYYGVYRVILLSVNQEYIDLLKSNSNSATSQTLNNTFTNIVNGYGIFTGMQAAADTLHLIVKPS